MNKKLIACAVAAGLSMSMTAGAMEVVGKKLEIYGKVHISVDASDTDSTSITPKSGTSVSSNSSRLGIKGQHAISDSLKVLYQIEQEVEFEDGSGSFATRNSFLGLKTSMGTFLAGHHDTPFKDVASKWGMFGDTVADRRAILGASATSGNKFNQRARNALMYKNKVGDLKISALYATDTAAGTAIDNDDKDTVSIGVLYKAKNLYFGAGYEKTKSLLTANSAVKGYRIMGGYKFGGAQIGLIYEDISADSTADSHIDRSAWGINGKVKLGSNMDIRAQYLVADDYEGVTNSGATMTAIGLFSKLDKKTQLYAAYTSTDNDPNAKYQGVDGGHGDEVKTDLGQSPSAFSVGLIFKF